MEYRFYHSGFATWYNSDNGLDWYAEDKKQGKPSRDRKKQRENKRQF